MIRFVHVAVILSAAALCAVASAAEVFPVERQLWEPIADDVYRQEVGDRIVTQVPVTSVAVADNRCYAVVNGAIQLVENGALRPFKSPADVKRLESFINELWALTQEGPYRLESGDWKRMANEEFVDLCMHLGALHGATREDAFRLEDGAFVSVMPEGGYLSSDITNVMEDGTQVLPDPVRFGPIDAIASYSGTLYALRPGQLVLFDGRIVDETGVDWGMLPSKNTRDLLALGSRLFITTDRGLAVLRGAAMTTLKGEDGLPFEDTTCLEEGFDKDLWIGTTRGAIRMLDDDWHYFGAQLWLPGDNVHDIAVGKDTVYIATDGGVGVIRYEPYTLLKKANYYERHLDEWGHKRLGFIQLLYQGENGEWIREVSDNDGGHTAPYLAAMSYKYAVTGDEKARREAVDAFKAMIWLEAITPVDGLIARAIWSAKGDLDQRATQGSGGLPAKWFPTDDGLWYWKGDTSSDEVDAHFYSVAIFHDLAAKGPEKERAKEHLARAAAHIIDNGWVVRDLDGKPTRWGRWDPDYLLRPYGYDARGLNGMEAQSIARTAYALTGDRKFADAFDQLMNWGYHNYTVRQRLTFPPHTIAPWDDNLAFRTYHNLFRYTDDPRLRSIYLRSIARSWEVKRMEHVSWYNLLYAAVSGNDAELDEAAEHMRAWPLDCRDWSYTNSHRHDLATEPGYVVYAVGTRGMSARETSVKRGHRDALEYDGNAGGKRVTEPVEFLRDYWMGRYLGLILAPETDDPKLTSVPRTGRQLGAKPYDGPPRPDNLIPGEK